MLHYAAMGGVDDIDIPLPPSERAAAT